MEKVRFYSSAHCSEVLFNTDTVIVHVIHIMRNCETTFSTQKYFKALEFHMEASSPKMLFFNYGSLVFCA